MDSNPRLRRALPLIALRRTCSSELALLLLTCPLLPALATAQPNTLNIDPNQAFVWSETVGWINFLPRHGGVTVHADHLTGFAWSENIGWIKLGADGGGPYANSSAADWGVNRAADGTLSGFAWSENAGWINFGATHGGVAVDPRSGAADGFAWGGNVGWIHFRNEQAGYGLGVLLAVLEVPTLSEWGVITLALLLGGVAIRRLRMA